MTMRTKLFEIIAAAFNNIDGCSAEIHDDAFNKVFVLIGGQRVLGASVSREGRHSHDYKISLDSWGSNVRKRSMKVRLIEGVEISHDDIDTINAFAERMITKIKETKAEEEARKIKQKETNEAYNQKITDYVKDIPDVTFDTYTGHVTYKDKYRMGVHFTNDTLMVYVAVSQVSSMTKKAVKLEDAIKILDMIM